jgi:NDP-sugar pyrophosphorylase family protein
MPIEMNESYVAGRPLASFAADTGVCMLAAGLATRLEPISSIIAKPAFPLGGQTPIIELWVRRFVDAGLNRIAMNLHRAPESIRGHFGDGSRFLADITYVDERVPSGTLGGAIKMVRALQQKGFHPRRVFIPSGDIVSTIDSRHLQAMLDLHTRNGAAVTMMLAPIPWDRRGDFGTTVLDGIRAGQPVPPGTYSPVTEFREKDPTSPSNENNASNYLIETSFLLELEPYLTAAQPDIEDPCYDFGKHMFPAMRGKIPHLGSLARYADQLFGYEPGALWFDVGNKRDYLDVNAAVLNRTLPLPTPYHEHPWGWIGEQVDIDFSRVVIRAPVVIGHGCTIRPGAEIGPNVVLGDGWTCSKGARIRDAVLWRRYERAVSASDPAELNGVREIRENVIVESAIVVRGAISLDVHGQTVDALPDGTLDVRSLDWVPGGIRA